MAFYDGWGKKIQQTGQGAIDRTKKSAETTRLNSSIRSVEKDMVKDFEELGRAYFEKHAEDRDYDPDMEKYFESLIAQVEQIDEYREQLRILNDSRTCPACGREISETATFCSYCGAKVEQPAPTGRTCPNCGAPLEDDQLFCTTCGTKVEPPAPEERVCPNCGAPLEDDQLFCTACGTKIEG